MLPLNSADPEDLGRALAERAKRRRLDMNLTQAGVAMRAGMSARSLKRFESTGEIALTSLLRIAHVLDATREFQQLFPEKAPLSLDDILKKKKQRMRGSRR